MAETMNRFTIKLTIEVEGSASLARAVLMDHCAEVLARHMPAVIWVDTDGDAWDAFVLSDTLQVTQRRKTK